jgi:hypothetical protein
VKRASDQLIAALEKEVARLHAENEQLCLQREGLLCRVAELRTLLKAVVQEADRATPAFDKAHAELGPS